MPLLARYSAWVRNCSGLPLDQPPPKKKTIAGRLSSAFQAGGRGTHTLRSRPSTCLSALVWTLSAFFSCATAAGARHATATRATRDGWRAIGGPFVVGVSIQ